MAFFCHVVVHTVVQFLSYYPLLGWELETAASAGEQKGYQQKIAKFLQEKVYRKMTSEVSARTVIQQTGTREWRLRAGIQLLLEHA